ncbi:hypothetical protein BDZ89DRAFT_1058233 [Hymenopellis radicata]|nr:hypothetical protein BDZ89DRAFT_1058233 [Hymenopellis radicata]
MAAEEEKSLENPEPVLKASESVEAEVPDQGKEQDEGEESDEYDVEDDDEEDEEEGDDEEEGGENLTALLLGNGASGAAELGIRKKTRRRRNTPKKFKSTTVPQRRGPLKRWMRRETGAEAKKSKV